MKTQLSAPPEQTHLDSEVLNLIRQHFSSLRSDRKRLIVPGLIALWLSAGFIHFAITSCSNSGITQIAPPPHIPDATFVGNQACITCHANISQAFPGSVHSRVSVPHHRDLPTDTSCESCHGPASKHVATGGGTSLNRHIANPGKSAESCLKCHLTTEAEFRLPHHHPVLEKQMSCVACHDPHGHDIHHPNDPHLARQQDASCASCHKEQARTFTFEHEAMQEGCTTCHQPHGSVNKKMLTQPDSNLCLKCHAQVPGEGGAVVIGQSDHSFYLTQGSCFSCHTAVHGSNIHPKLLY